MYSTSIDLLNIWDCLHPLKQQDISYMIKALMEKALWYFVIVVISHNGERTMTHLWFNVYLFLYKGQERKEEKVKRGRKKSWVEERSEKGAEQLGTTASKVQNSSPVRRVHPSPTEARAANAR